MKSSHKIILLILIAALIPALIWSRSQYLRYRTRRDRATLAEDYCNRGVSLNRAGQYQEAIVLFRQALELAPGDTLLLTNLAVTYCNWILVAYQQGDNQKALELGARARLEGIRNPLVYYYNARAFYRDGNPDSAHILLRTARDSMPYSELVSDWLESLDSERGVANDFENSRSGYFEIMFEGSQNREVSDQVLMLLENIRDQVGSELGYRMQRTTRVILYSDQQFRDITHLAGWAGAAFDGQIKIPIASYRNDQALLNKVLIHEFTHAAIYDMAGGRTPAWLNEGLAMLFEGENSKDPLYLPLSALKQPFTKMEPGQAIKAYKASLSAVSYLSQQYDRAFIRMLFSRLQAGNDFEPAFKDTYGLTVPEFEKRWKESL